MSERAYEDGTPAAYGPGTDATTADGFRVGRRVRIKGGTDEGDIVRSGAAKEWWIRWDSGGEGNWHENRLFLLPDAPATPEPRFKPGDKVTEGGVDTIGTIDRITGIGNYVVRWPNGIEIPYAESRLNPAPLITPEPAPAAEPAKDHYAILRERGFEPWDVMQASFPADWCLAYNVLTALAYLQRCTLKHPTPDDDIRKAHDHLAEAVRILDSKGAA